ncbi:MAG TPA: cob(I)yrinic acid a,c-diamide adenosyltransferase [bacterium]
MIQIYTGNGKGKTTAALGMALRAVGHGKRVIMIQFMKGQIKYGELKAARILKKLVIEQYGRKEFVDRDRPAAIDRELARRGMDRAWQVLKDRHYGIIILDEINVAVEYGLVPAAEVIRFMRKAPKRTELVLTGRYMPPEFIRYADLISEIVEVKHHFEKGVQARCGIEY